MWVSGWCPEEKYYGKPVVYQSIIAQDRKDAIEQAFIALFRKRGKIMKPAKGGEKGPYFVAFISQGMINDCGKITIYGQYYLVHAKHKKQAWAYLDSVMGNYPDWIEQVTTKQIRRVALTPTSTDHFSTDQQYAELDQLCPNCRKPVTVQDRETDFCLYCEEEIVGN